MKCLLFAILLAIAAAPASWLPATARAAEPSALEKEFVSPPAGGQTVGLLVLAQQQHY